jgi:choline dehydrogenase-like flavoprotein
VFFGGAVMRYRVGDFHVDPAIAGDSGAEWPIGYGAMEPWYAAAEAALDVAGSAGDGPGEPHRSGPYPQPAAPLSPVARRLAAAVTSVGLTPTRLPLAINYRPGTRRCVGCSACDSYACALGAKNDPSAAVLPDLLAGGLELRTGTVVARVEAAGGSVTGLLCLDRVSGRWLRVRARAYVLAAGALATPHLLLASGLDRRNPAGHVVGRYLMRHCNAVVFGVFPKSLDGVDAFHKQLYVGDLYFGHPSVASPAGKLGVIQQIHPPPPGLLQAMLPRPLAALTCAVRPHMTGLVVIAEDQPRAENRLTLDHGLRDRFGLPRAVVVHRYSDRDLAARDALIGAARRILRQAGAAACYVHPIRTFSHAVGTVRMGADPRSAPLDAEGRFRGLDNLFVADASALPTSAGVNPALTIGANAFRVGAALARTLAVPGVSYAENRVPRLRLGHADP